jgi:hypothetical protein
MSWQVERTLPLPFMVLISGVVLALVLSKRRVAMSLPSSNDFSQRILPHASDYCTDKCLSVG